MKNVQDRRIELLLSGRAGIDLNTTKAGCTFADIPAFTKSVGGSPANIVQGAARLGLENYFFDVPQSTSINKAIPIPAIKKKILILFFFTNPTIPMIIKRIETINDI